LAGFELHNNNHFLVYSNGAQFVTVAAKFLFHIEESLRAPDSCEIHVLPLGQDMCY